MKGASISAAAPFSHTKCKQTACQAQRTRESRALENTAAMQRQSREGQRERKPPTSISFSHLNIFSQHGMKAPESKISEALEVQPLKSCTSTAAAAKIVIEAVTL
ncbi:uncharacterized [Tachysurus ichikawai]